MWKKIKNLLLYAWLDYDQFLKANPLANDENAVALKLASVVQMLYFGMSLISSLGLAEMADKRLVYGIGTIVPSLILIVHLLYSERHPSLVAHLVRILSAGIFITALLCTLVCTPDEMTILLLIFFFCVPMVFVLRPFELIILVFCADVIYYIHAPLLKSPAILKMDMIDIGIFSTLSVILGICHIRDRYKMYWLETEAVDLAEVRYQAAFIDQLTGAFNRNAYNREIETLEKTSLPEDFMYMALDLNGLKTANDTFGHVAGDELIIGAADCMKKCFEEYGKVYRSGGDEFIIMLNTKDKTEGELLNAFNQTIDAWHGSIVTRMSASYGVVKSCECSKMSFREIELLADKRMYQAKSDYYKMSQQGRPSLTHGR